MTKQLLRLYIAGKTASSRRAERNLSDLKFRLAPDQWEIEIVDVLAHPERAEHAAILATPTLSYEHASRPRRIVGDLSDARRVLEFLGIDLKGNDA